MRQKHPLTGSCSISLLPLLFLLHLSICSLPAAAAAEQQPVLLLPASEQEAVYLVLESINSEVNWRDLYPDDLCLGGPHGVVCDLFHEPGRSDGGAAPLVPHVTELNFGYISDFSPNPPCGPNPAFTPRLSSFPFLRKLFFYGCFNRSRTPIPSHFWNLLSSSLEELVFVGNPSLGGRLSGGIGNFTRLRRLVLSGSRISGNVPAEIGNLPNLEQLVLSRNRLLGVIPATLGGCERLKILDLSGNRIAGRLPPEIGRLGELVKLDLSGNQIWGQIPGEFFGLRRLEFLDLSRNNLTGGIPVALAEMVSLKEVYMSGNRLGGRIPEIWEKLGGILGLGMSGLELEGNIPASMGVFLRKVCYLGLDNNRLEGTVPEQFRRLEGTAGEINLENNLLSGRIPFSAGFVVGIGGKLKLGGNPQLCLDGELLAAAAEERARGRGRLGGLEYPVPCNKTQISHPVLFFSAVSSSSSRPSLFPFSFPLFIVFSHLFLGFN